MSTSHQTPSQLLTSLLRTLCTVTPNPSENTTNLPDFSKPFLLTLHSIYPYILLDALDLLDKGCVTCVRTNPSTCSEASSNARGAEREAWLVRSAAQILNSSRSTTTTATSSNEHDEETEGYLVHLYAWHCTCPAFTYSTFTSTSASSPNSSSAVPYQPIPSDAALANDAKGNDKGCEGLPFGFGGVPALKEDGEVRKKGGGKVPPGCKHLLAAALAKCAPGLFQSAGGQERGSGGRKGVGERRVDGMEFAGLVAGG